MGEGGADRAGLPHPEQPAMPSGLILSLHTHPNPLLGLRLLYKYGVKKTKLGCYCK
jgi:hypothetical protein